MELTEQERHDIYMTHYPTVQELEAYRTYYQTYCNYGPTMDVMELKLAATKTVPTVLEETMSVAQLVKSGSPLWARPYSMYELFVIMTKRNKINDEMFAQLLEQATDYETLLRELIQLRENLRKREKGNRRGTTSH